MTNIIIYETFSVRKTENLETNKIVVREYV